MKTNIFRWCLSLLISLFLVNAASAATRNYLMWQLPGTGISYPVYVYHGGNQVGYIPSNTLQVFVGSYTSGTTSGSYHLYYQNAGAWYGCKIVLTSGSIDPSTTCTGTVINPPAAQNGAQSNVYTIAMAALAWPAETNAPSSPTNTDYGNRTISFKNNTNYPVIQIGESCNPNNASNSAPSCQNTPIVATIQKGTPYVVTVGLNGLNSSAFYMSSYCTAKSAAQCATAPTIAQCSGTPNPPKNWVCTGGYFPGQTPYATKIEPTILAVADGVPNGASNIDVSAVDGYSVGVKLYPAIPAYCTYTVPPENSNVLGAGYYGGASPLAQISPRKATSLAAMCKMSSQLPNPALKKGMPWNLSKLSPGGAFEGCMSPCSYATAKVGTHGITANTVNQFCCIGSYNTPGTCDVGAGQVGANTSTYNTNIQNSSQFQNVYGFAFGDAGSDYACPPETNFVVEFVSAQ